MLRSRLVSVWLRAGGPHREAAVNSAGARRRHASSTTTEVTGDARQKTIDDLGGPSVLTTLNWLFVKGYLPKTQQMQVEQSKIYGPLWKSTYGPLVVVNVASADLIEEVLRQEGRHPLRSDMPHWRRYRELRNQAHGPLTEWGERPGGDLDSPISLLEVTVLLLLLLG